MGRVTIQGIGRERLVELALDAERNPGRFEVVPLTRHRAAAQAANPMASDDDVLLLLASYRGTCIGYMGLLPHLVSTKRDVKKIYCVTSLFVAEEYRRETQAARLLLEAAKGLDVDVLSVGNSVAATRFFRKHHLTELPPYDVLHIRLGYGARLERARNGALTRLRGYGMNAASSIFDDVSRPCVRLMAKPGRSRDSSRLMKCAQDLGAALVPRFSDDIPIARDDLGTHTFRDARTLNWILAYPWVFEDPWRLFEAPRPYRFSNARAVFRFFAYEFRENNASPPSGYALFLLTSRHGQYSVSVLDHHLPASKRPEDLLALAAQLAARVGADLLIGGQETFDRIQVPERIFARVPRIAFVLLAKSGSIFKSSSPLYKQQYWDGDISFY